MSVSLENLVRKAVQGDKDALEEIVRRIQDRIYALSIRMLYDPGDAEDATQEILVKIITHLGGFRGESAFGTWVWRIAANHLLTTRKRRAERRAKSFEEYERIIDRDAGEAWQERDSHALQRLIVEEIRISCLQALLLSLDRGHRLAYILVQVLDFSPRSGAEILGVKHAAFRKRLSRGRARLVHFMTRNCRLIHPTNRCQCERVAARELERGGVDPAKLRFADNPCRVKHQETTLARLGELDELKRIGVLYKTCTDFRSPESVMENVKNIVTTKRYSIF